jgi:menaquinone-dependent protoporphyrinogen oxidase
MDKKLLVTYASKEDATVEIAERIGKDLVAKGLQVDVMPVNEVKKVTSYDAVVVGSCVYIGQWNEDAILFVKKFEDDLRFLPVWIFSSDPTDSGDIYRLVRGWRLPNVVQKYVDRIEPEGVTIFHEHVEADQVNWLEKWMKGKSENNDAGFRDWHKVDNWATQIAAHLV